jgi:hypothetical protein
MPEECSTSNKQFFLVTPKTKAKQKSYIKKISIQVFTTTALPAQSGTRLSNEVREEKPKTKKQKKSP